MPLTSLAVSDHVATLTLDPPGGVFDRAVAEALRAATEEVAGRLDEVRAVVVRSAGPDLGTGWSERALEEGDALGGVLAPLGAAFDALAGLPQPVVAAIEGRAHSAGLELALACDIRVASSAATFALPETALGLVPRGGGTQRLPSAVGRAQALRMVLTGEVIDAAEARRIGLVSAVVSEGEAAAKAMEIAAQIAARGPLATRFVKEAIARGSELSLDQALRLELELTVLLQTTEDRAEGVRAFIERRPPQFRGR